MITDIKDFYQNIRKFKVTNTWEKQVKNQKRPKAIGEPTGGRVSTVSAQVTDGSTPQSIESNHQCSQ